ncbi:uncharacterized protein LOC129725660 [Wyeomyia smithii]|uniref:uncharacterized protein LOC129725660 n=1 Tax=Wyeomyia smithii TaxID=174621 RepID=UPI002467E6EE|nr:uncharacterized protein LOC129725660 [Wyeomyia smithii]
MIVGIFRKENKDTYYVERKGNPGGKLYSRINYIKQADRKRNRREDTRQSVTTELENIELPEVTNAISWLQLNRAPWNSVLDNLQTSFPGRQELLKNKKKAAKLSTTYPHLEDEFGFPLLDIDYQLLGFGDPSEGQGKWARLIDPVRKYISTYGKDISLSILLPVIHNTDN